VPTSLSSTYVCSSSCNSFYSDVKLTHRSRRLHLPSPSPYLSSSLYHLRPQLPEEQVDADETKRLIERAGRTCLCIPQDIRDEAGCKSVIEKVVKEFGRIDVLVNNASVMYTVQNIEDVTTEQVRLSSLHSC
jgi:hypothetical protein